MNNSSAARPANARRYEDVRSSNGSSYQPGTSSSYRPGAYRGIGALKKRSPAFEEKALQIKEQIAAAREDFSELRQDACDLQEYSDAKLSRVTRYLGVLAEKARKLDQAASEVEQRIAPLKQERKKLFNELLSAKGNIRVFCRVRPQFEHEGSSGVSFPDEFSIRILQSADGSVLAASARKEFELDHVYGPHISQATLFHDIQPLVQAVLDGYNASIICYGQSGSGKTHTMEGPSHDRGLLYRSFDELFDLATAHSNLTPTSQFTFHVSAIEIYNERLRDLLRKGGDYNRNYDVRESPEDGVSVVGLHEEQVETPQEFARTAKLASAQRNARKLRSHMLLTVHVRHLDVVSGERTHCKLYLADLAGSERLTNRAEATGDRLTESLHINKSLSALGDCMSALTSKKGSPPYYNSKLTHILSDSLGGDAKALLIVHCSPNTSDIAESIATLQFAARARNVEISLGSKDTMKKWRDIANDARKETYEKEKALGQKQEEVIALEQALQAANEKMESQLAEAAEQAKRQLAEVEKQLKRQIVELTAKIEEGNALAESLEAEVVDRDKYIDVLQEEMAEKARAVQAQQDALLAQQKTQLEAAARARLDRAMGERHAAVAGLEVRVAQLEQQLAEATAAAEAAAAAAAVATAKGGKSRGSDGAGGSREDALMMQLEQERKENRRLEIELQKQNELIENLNKESETLLERLHTMTSTNRHAELAADFLESGPRSSSATQRTPDSQSQRHAQAQAQTPPASLPESPTSSSTSQSAPSNTRDTGRRAIPLDVPRSPSGDVGSGSTSPGSTSRSGNTTPVQQRSKTGAGQFLASSLADFDPDSFSDRAAVADAANKLLMLVLTAASKAGPGRNNSLLSELQEAVSAFLQRMQPLNVLDSMLVARTRLLYLRNVLAQHAEEFKDLLVHPLESFLEGGTGSRDSKSRGNGTEPSHSRSNSADFSSTSLWDSEVKPFRVNLFGSRADHKLQPKSKHSSGWSSPAVKGTVDPAAVRELCQDATRFATSNCQLAATFAHTEHEELQGRLRRWLAENFEFLSPLEEDDGDNDLMTITSSLIDSWQLGLGKGGPRQSDALGQVLAEYRLMLFTVPLNHLKDVSQTLAVEHVDDLAEIQRTLAALQAVDHKRRKLLQQLKAQKHSVQCSEATLEPFQEEEPRIASLQSLEELISITESVQRSNSFSTSLAAKKRAQLGQLLSEAVPKLEPIDRPLAEQAIEKANKALEALALPGSPLHSPRQLRRHGAGSPGDGPSSLRDTFPAEGGAGIPSALRGETIQWSVVQFNKKQGTPPVLVKCGATSKLAMAVKAAGGGQAGSEAVAVMMPPGSFCKLAYEGMIGELDLLPEAIRDLAISKTEAQIRMRYSRLYKTLAARIPALRPSLGSELDEFLPGLSTSQGSSMSSTPQSKSPVHDLARRSNSMH